MKHSPECLTTFIQMSLTLRDREDPGSTPGRDIPMSLTMVLVAPCWHSDFRGRARTGRSSVSRWYQVKVSGI